MRYVNYFEIKTFFLFEIKVFFSHFLKKILLERVSVTESKSYSKGNSKFDLNIKDYSTISCLGEFNTLKENKIKKVEFYEIGNKKGYISKYKKI